MAKPAAAADPIPPLLWPAEEAAAGEMEGFDADPKPLHRSLVELRAEGEPAARAPFDRDPRDAASAGATELANTGRPPLWLTPAVAPLSRAAKTEEGDGEGSPAPLEPRPALRLVPPLTGRVAPPVDLAAPLVEPATEPEPLDADEEGAAEGAAACAPAGVELAAGVGADEAALLPLVVPPPAVASAPGVAGVPNPGPVQAQARLTTTTLVANAASTDTEIKRLRPHIKTTSPLRSRAC